MTLSAFVSFLLDNKGDLVMAIAGLIAAASVFIKALEVLVAVLLKFFPQLKAADGQLQHIAAWLDALAKWGPLNALAVNPKSLKALVAAVAIGLFVPAPAHAYGLDWSTGPTVPFLEYDFGQSVPVQVVPGAGLQLSITHTALQRPFVGKYWDLVGLQLSAFGSVVRADSPASFGVLSAAASLCVMSSLVCGGVGRHLLGPDFVFQHGGWFGVLSLNINFAVGAAAPTAKASLPKANTMYLVGGP